ncbi:MAG: class I SAM-dependent RNA methyltransferase [Rhodobacteraceae bacterium]|nr:class I SAM-dependent RNA methyltransferase [Paracoccaceae bacterium]
MSITIERLGHLGDGIAPGPVFVPLTLPGEVVSGEQQGDRIPAPKIEQPSEHRVKPPCPHFRSCGGCALQHATDPFVALWKTEVVKTALAAQGIDAPIRGIATSPSASRRRASLSGRRTKKGSIVGFHARASDTVIEVPECRVLHPDLLACLPLLHELTRRTGSRKGEVSFALTRSRAGIDLAVTGAKPMDTGLRIELAELAGIHDLARLAWEGEVVVERRPPWQAFGSARVVPPSGAFLQATEEGEAALLAAVKEAVGKANRIVDLFAGCGTFALPLAAVAEVHAVEGEGDMLGAMDRGWRQAQGLKRITHEARDLFRRPLMSAELAKFDAAVIDPPRAGAEAQTAELAKSEIPRIAAVSCNPVTFARDARLLVSAGYRLSWVRVVDQFRWSPHVELAAAFSRD